MIIQTGKYLRGSRGILSPHTGQSFGSVAHPARHHTRTAADRRARKMNSRPGRLRGVTHVIHREPLAVRSASISRHSQKRKVESDLSTPRTPRSVVHGNATSGPLVSISSRSSPPRRPDSVPDTAQLDRARASADMTRPPQTRHGAVACFARRPTRRGPDVRRADGRTPAKPRVLARDADRTRSAPTRGKAPGIALTESAVGVRLRLPTGREELPTQPRRLPMGPYTPSSSLKGVRQRIDYAPGDGEPTRRPLPWRVQGTEARRTGRAFPDCCRAR